MTSWRTAPASAEVNGASLTIQAEAWRSFMPTADTSAARMIVVLRLAGPAIPDGVSIDSLLLVQGASEWRGQARAEQERQPGAGMVEFVCRDGPAWATGSTMDVIARVRLPGGHQVVLRAAEVRIERVD